VGRWCEGALHEPTRQPRLPGPCRYRWWRARSFEPRRLVATSSTVIAVTTSASVIIRAEIATAPKCQSLARAQWLDDRRSELLDTQYFHVIFTVPQPIATIRLLLSPAERVRQVCGRIRTLLPTRLDRNLAQADADQVAHSHGFSYLRNEAGRFSWIEGRWF
jgi:hypothetical protein